MSEETITPEAPAAPVEEAPEAPVEEAPVEEAPVAEAPVEEPAPTPAEALANAVQALQLAASRYATAMQAQVHTANGVADAERAVEIAEAGVDAAKADDDTAKANIDTARANGRQCGVDCASAVDAFTNATFGS